PFFYRRLALRGGSELIRLSTESEAELHILYFNAFSSREPVSTSLENALAPRPAPARSRAAPWTVRSAARGRGAHRHVRAAELPGQFLQRTDAVLGRRVRR